MEFPLVSSEVYCWLYVLYQAKMTLSKCQKFINVFQLDSVMKAFTDWS